VEAAGLPPGHAYHHTTFFLSWLAKNDLLSELFVSETPDQIAAYKAGRCTVNPLYEWWDCCLVIGDW
jgi:hypothetical protein